MLAAEPTWEEWIASNLRSGCDPADMQARMVAAGWSEKRAAAALSDGMAGLLPPLAGPPALIPLPIIPEMGVIQCDGRDVKITLRLADPAMALCEDILSAEECAEFLDFAAKRGLQPSTIVDDTSGAARPHPERTSTSLMLRRAETELVDRIEHRLAALTGWPVANGEGLQILRYRTGQEYRPHFDSFPDGAGGAIHTARGGQRVNTVLIYLQSPERGGGTCFPSAGLTVCPRAGSAVIFHNVDEVGRRAAASLHAGLPVENGEKIIITYWQRARAFAAPPEPDIP